MSSLTGQIFTVLKEANRLDLYEKVAEAWEKNSALRDEVDKLKVQNKKFRNDADLENRLNRDGNKEWLVLEHDKDQEARYCTFCWDKSKDLIRLRRGIYEGVCKSCNALYGDSTDVLQDHYEAPTFW